MPGAHRTYERGPVTYEVNVAVAGGLLVEPDSTTGRIKPATANSTKVLGVALKDSQPAGSNPTSPLDVSWPSQYTAVAYGPTEVDLTYSSAAAFGVLLVCSGAGKVAPYTPGTSTFDQIVGRCTAEAGVGANGVGRARLF